MSNPQLEPEHAEPSEDGLRQMLDARERENIRFGMELLNFMQPHTPPPSGASVPRKQA